MELEPKNKKKKKKKFLAREGGPCCSRDMHLMARPRFNLEVFRPILFFCLSCL